VLPPSEPLHVQLQLVPLATVEAVPALQSPVDGAAAKVPPCAEPQAPTTGDGQDS
jgi:hypothetical protein